MDAHPSALEGPARVIALSLELLMGISAVFGAYHLLDDPRAFGAKLSWLEGSPFPDYTIPGLYLGVVIGGGMAAAGVAAGRRSRHAARAALLMGLVLLAWLAVETVIVGFRGWQQIPLLAICGTSGAVLAALGGHSLVGSSTEGSQR